MINFLFFVAAFAAELAGTMASFGSSTIFLPIALFFIDFKTALVLVAILHMSGSIGRIAFFRRDFNKRLAISFGIPSILLAISGALLVIYTPQEILKFLLGVFLLLFSVISFLKPSFSFNASSRNAVFGGALSGFLAGLIGTGGALRSAFLNSFNLKKETYIATTALIALAVDLTRIPIYVNSGFLEPQYYYFIPILFVAAIAGSFVGKKLVNKIPQHSFRKIVLIAIAVVSLKFIAEGLVFLLA